MFKQTKTVILQLMQLFRRYTLAFCIVLSTGPLFVDGGGDFTQVPGSVILVQSGKNATFHWDYEVENKYLDFSSFSPRWSFFNASGDEWIIGRDNRVKNWQWEVTPDTCPPRLLKPTVRVDKINKATLFILNVTTADNGIYGCTLVLTRPKTSKAELVVTVTPQITSADKKNITEHHKLTVNCSAIGPPTPNVTWRKTENNKEVLLAFGENGRAELIIYNITRNQSGIYNCSAINNPSEPPVVKETHISVHYSPELNEQDSSKTVAACIGQENVPLYCKARGVPKPSLSWYMPGMILVPNNPKEDSYVIKVVKKDHFGNWTCNITNDVEPGIYHSISLVPREDPSKCRKNDEGKGLNTGEKVAIGFGATAPVVILAGLGARYYNKKKKGAKSKGINVENVEKQEEEHDN